MAPLKTSSFAHRTLYQIDRTACSGEDSDGRPRAVDVRDRLEWIAAGQRGALDGVRPEDVEKYLRRGTEAMPWTELSQKDFVEFVAPYRWDVGGLRGSTLKFYSIKFGIFNVLIIVNSEGYV